MEQWREDVLIHYGVKGMKWRHRKRKRLLNEASERSRKANRDWYQYKKTADNTETGWDSAIDALSRYANKHGEDFAWKVADARSNAVTTRSAYLKKKADDAVKAASLMGRSYESNARREKELEKNAKKKLEQTARSYESTARRKQALEKQKSSKRDKVKNTINKILSRVKR